MPELKELIVEVREVADRAVRFIQEQRSTFKSHFVESKGLHDLVSYVDRQSEKILVEGLQPLLPSASFITEEGTVAAEESEFKWIIDPLDGTTNFIHGMPCYAVSIGLMRGDEIILGLVHEINQSECFYAWKGGGAWLNGQPVRVSEASSADEALLATGFPYTNFDRMDAYMRVFDWGMRNTRGLRRLGSAAVDLAYVACGRMDAFYEYGLKPWDVAGGICLVAEAGGRISDFRGGKAYVFGAEIVASNELFHSEIMEVVKKEFS